jgi:hypothetical protein
VKARQRKLKLNGKNNPQSAGRVITVGQDYSLFPFIYHVLLQILSETNLCPLHRCPPSYKGHLSLRSMEKTYKARNGLYIFFERRLVTGK